jgi:hypothetical protein
MHAATIRGVRSAALLGALALMGGCESDETIAEVMAGIGVEPIIVPCTTCGDNARVAEVEFHELDSSPTPRPNDQGLVIEGWQRDADHEKLTLKVEGDRLKALSNEGWLEGQQLVDTTFTVAVDTTGNPEAACAEAKHYYLHIRGYDETSAFTAFWVDPGQGRIPLYQFEWTAEGGNDPIPLCERRDDGWGNVAGTAAIFTGDRYDLRTNTVTPRPLDDPWFTVACFGSALYKLHALRHTTASGTSTRVTTGPQRQAYLKMLSADYCGGVYQFTRTGFRLNYVDQQGFFPDGSGLPEDHPAKKPIKTVEAIWNENGPVCLNDPRLFTVDQIHRIDADCVLPPPCTAKQIVNWRRHGYIISGQPTP